MRPNFFRTVSIRLAMSSSLLVSGDRHRARTQFFLSRRDTLGTASGDDDLRPFRMKQFRGGEPDAGRTARDQCNPAVQFSHADMMTHLPGAIHALGTLAR